MIDANYMTDVRQQPPINIRKTNYSTATITKRRNPGVFAAIKNTIELNGADATEFIVNSNGNSSNDFVNDESAHIEHQAPDNQYEDIMDVQVIAKMQEESLRQSIQSMNKG